MSGLLGPGGDVRSGWLMPVTSGRLRLAAVSVATVLLLSLQNVLAMRPDLRLDLGTLVIVFLALEFDPLRGAVNALFVGYLVDVFAGGPRGVSAAAMVLVFVVLRLLVVRVAGVARFGTVTLASVFAVGLALLFRLLIEGLVGPDLIEADRAAPALPAAFLGALLFGYPLHRLLSKIDRRFRPSDEGVSSLRLGPRR